VTFSLWKNQATPAELTGCSHASPRHRHAMKQREKGKQMGSEHAPDQTQENDATLRAREQE